MLDQLVTSKACHELELACGVARIAMTRRPGAAGSDLAFNMQEEIAADEESINSMAVRPEKLITFAHAESFQRLNSGTEIESRMMSLETSECGVIRDCHGMHVPQNWIALTNY